MHPIDVFKICREARNNCIKWGSELIHILNDPSKLNNKLIKIEKHFPSAVGIDFQEFLESETNRSISISSEDYDIQVKKIIDTAQRRINMASIFNNDNELLETVIVNLVNFKRSIDSGIVSGIKRYNGISEINSKFPGFGGMYDIVYEVCTENLH